MPYRQALLWRLDTAKIKAASGVAIPEKNSPYALWLNSVLQHIARTDIAVFTAASCPPELAGDWAEWLPDQALWLPLTAPSGVKYALVLFREEEWKDGEIHLLSYLAEGYGHAFALTQAAQPPRSWLERLRSKRLQLIIAGVVLAALCFPMRQSVIAEAEAVSYHANLIRAPAGRCGGKILCATE